MNLSLLIDVTSIAVGTAIIAGVIGILINIIYLGVRQPEHRATAFVTVLGLTSWCTIMLYLSTWGNITPPTKELITERDFWGSISAPILTLAPILGFFWLRSRNKALHALTDDLNMRLLVGAQAYRMTGVIFLLFALSGPMPALIGIPTGISAFLVGLLGVGLAIFYRPQSQRWRRYSDWWNWFGLGYFSYAIILCLLCVAQVINLDPDPIPIFFYPIAFIGSFGVPFSVILHFIFHSRLKAIA
ncbi:MAG: hypothetical protein KUG59_07260 [Parvibaculaceae bacterium]|nr:hypothetical protein [Parvibaculaceae bacterium]